MIAGTFLGNDSEVKSKKFNNKMWRKLDLPYDWNNKANIHPKFSGESKF